VPTSRLTETGSNRSAPEADSARGVRDVVFVDGVRTPFGKSGKGVYAETRADDLVVKVIRELLRRNSQLPPERIDEVAIAATTQIGDQGLTIGRSAALLAGLPKSVPGFAIDRMCAGAMTAVTSVAGGIAFGAYDIAVTLLFPFVAIRLVASERASGAAKLMQQSPAGAPAMLAAKAVVLLCQTDFITGETIRVDGGRHLE